MKIKFLISIFIFLVIACALLFWRYKHIQNKYEQDYISLEKDIFLLDTENRGFSDKVKKDIEEKFSDLKIQKELFKYAKSARVLLRSKTENEYLIELRKSIQINNCILYLVFNSQNSNKVSLVNSVVIDNQSMKNFGLYLEQYKFNTKRFQEESLNILNDKSLNILTEKDFNEKCN